jgi:hypothetical protein
VSAASTRERGWPWRRAAPRSAPLAGAPADGAIQMYHVSKSYSAGSFALRDVSLRFAFVVLFFV